MNDREAGRFWNDNAEVWTKLVRAGYDIYRDHLNTPAFLEMLPDVRGMSGMDIGCGEGHNTRLLAQRGARVTGIDIAHQFIMHAVQAEAADPLGIRYCVASGVDLPFESAVFDFATAFMSLMDIPETAEAIGEIYRVLKPGAFLQISISHPCFDTPHRRNLRDQQGRTYAIEVGNYFQNLNGQIDEWLFKGAPALVKEGLPKFKIPRFTRTLSQWMNLFIERGFIIEQIREPRPSDGTVSACPKLQDAQIVAYFLHIRVRKQF